MADKLDGVLGINVRQPTQSERDFFLKNIKVGGYAAPDNSIVLNPFAPLYPDEQDAVAYNEALRILLRKNPDIRPQYTLTDEQKNSLLGSYSPNQQDINNTLFARIVTNDPSAMATNEQKLATQTWYDALVKSSNGIRKE